MAFVTGYENDIFISYSHIDNDPIVEGKPGWVDFFEELLRKRIRVRLGAEVTIFRDAQLRRYGKFSDQLTKTISSSAAFICVLSPRYVQSDWCLHELSQFCRGLGAGRIIKVVKTAFDEPASDAEIRSLFAEIRDVLDCRFYRKDTRRGLFKDLQPEVIPDDVPACIDETDRIAQNIAELLRKLRAASDLPRPANAVREGPKISADASDANKHVVYLAETTTDLADKRNDIRTELLQFDWTVLPDQPLPQESKSVIKVVNAALGRAKLSIHLIGTNYGVVPEAEQRSIPHIQYDLAAEAATNRNLVQLVWMPDGVVPIDDRQQKFIADVKNRSPEFLQTKIEDLKTEIHKKLAPELTNVWGDEDDEHSINLSLFCHAQDLDSVAPLHSYLTLEKFFRVKLPVKDAQSFQNHKQLLETSDAVLLYYGTADEDWFVNIWKLIQRQTSVGRKKPVLAKAIYAAQPPTAEKDLLRSEDPMIIRNYGQFNPDSLSPFIQKISAARGGVL